MNLKKHIGKRLLLPTLMGGLVLVPAARMAAQTFTTLYNFTGHKSAQNRTNSDGSSPTSSLVLGGDTFYGTAYGGGTSNYGTVFSIKFDGSGFTNLHNFTGGTNGANPAAALILAGNTLFGTTENLAPGLSTVFRINIDGTAFTTLHTFNATNDGDDLSSPLVLSSNTLYGTAEDGGGPRWGTVFKLNTDGSGFTVLYSFTNGNDGIHPVGGLILSSNTLYGTAYGGGPTGDGSVFSIKTDGTEFATLNYFGGEDGSRPEGTMILSGNTLYGTTSGGSAYYGTVFAMNTDGSGFTNLHSFSTVGDGAYPYAGIILSNDTLYGTTEAGGLMGGVIAQGWGTVFAVKTDGSDFTILHNFTTPDGISTAAGAVPQAGVILSGNAMYGVCSEGGKSGAGTIFSLSFAPQLAITPSGTSVILTWPTNVDGFDYSGFTLQFTTNLISPNAWNSVPPPAAVVNGQNTVTNQISGTQMFYRLAQ